MLHLLAQDAPGADDPAATLPRFDPSQWALDSSLIVTGSLVALGILAGGFLVLALAQRFLARARLTTPLLVAIVACATYFGIATMKPAPQLAFWLSRLFYAALLFSIFHAADRLLLIPLMTRGGRVPIQRFIHQIIVIVASIFLVLGFGSFAFGWDIDKFLAGSAVVSIVLGLALQESLGNFFSGLVMHASNPFAIGDWIVVGEVEGRVVDMNWRAVTIETDDDNFVIVPNAKIAGDMITNFNAPTRATARSVFVGIDYDVPPLDAIELLRATALETPRVMAEPRPRIFLLEFADSSVNYRIEFWIEDMPNHLEIEQDVRVNLWYRLKQRGYSIPFPIRTVEHVPLDRKVARSGEQSAGERLRAIESVPLLAPLSADQRKELASAARTIDLGTDQCVFKQGESGESFYAIARGEVDVLLEKDGASRAIATLKAGDFFGEMSALTGQPRTATIRARTPIRLVEISKSALEGIFAADPSIMEKLSEIIARRNAEREAAATQAGTELLAASVAEQQQSLFQRMRRFFARG